MDWWLASLTIPIDLTGKVALVTGGSRGIGRAVSLSLATAGANVIVNYVRDRAAAEETVRGVEELGRTAWLAPFDVADAGAVKKEVARAAARLGAVDILISNAGQSTSMRTADADDDEFRRVIDVNVKGLMTLGQCVLPEMIARGSGRIVAISSIVAKTGKAFLSVSPTYAAAKAGIIGMVRGMAREAAPYGVTVNSIRPGWIDTDSTALAPDKVRAQAILDIPVGRTGTPADIAGAVLFLCSDLAAYVTGVALDVNGGLFIG